MPISDLTLRNRFRGCLLGLAVGDALGGRFEAQDANAIRSRFPTPTALFSYPQDEIWYTDDTQMAIAVAESLTQVGQITEEDLCRDFVANYVPSRGYGRGARVVLDAMEEGEDYRSIAESYFPGGSYGNGAAMRVAPVGLLFRRDRAQLWEQARLSALPTHRHPLGIEGAQLLALAVSLASHLEQFDHDRFFAELIDACESNEYRTQMRTAVKVQTTEQLAELGNRIDALYSVPTAIAGFALSPNSYEETVGNLILLGGDTDTLGAMGGAIAGTYLGAEQLPSRVVGLLESSPKGRVYIANLANALFQTYTEQSLQE